MVNVNNVTTMYTGKYLETLGILIIAVLKLDVTNGQEFMIKREISS